MKANFKNTLLVALSATSAVIGSASAVDTSNGDVLIGFYQIDVSDNVSPLTYVFNLGPASLIRENTRNNVLISVVNPAISSANINADLSAVFGADWADSGTVFWGIVGGLDQTTTGLVGGDTQGTSYISRPVTNFVASGSTTTQPAVSGGVRPTLRNNIEAFLTGSDNSGTIGSNPRGARIPTSIVSSFEDFLPPVITNGSQFGVIQEVRQRFDADVLPNSSNIEGALDIWRLIGGTSTANLNASGADFTSGFGSGNVVLGQGQFCGTITIDTSGTIKVGGTALAATANFESFATTNGLTGGPNGDSDADGVNNLTEYALVTNLAKSDGSLGTFVNRLLSFNKRGEAVTNGDITYAIEESDDLGISDPWQTITPTENTMTTISYQLPVGATRKFARLKLLKNP